MATNLACPGACPKSEYNARDIEQTYQYSSFGVPDLGYKRGLGENIVIAPYASGLASMIDPAAAARNFERMADIGARGVYGWYEALDYTRARLPEGAKVAIIRAYMAHHQAMTIVGIANALQDGRMRARFHAEPIVQAAELLLQERMPRDVAVARPPPEQATAAAQNASLVPDAQRHYASAHSRVPRTHLLSNGRYSAMVTAAGSGYSRWHDVAITRWREDVTCDGWGAYIFLRDVRSGEIWSAGYQPSAVEPDSYDVTFSEDRAEIIRRDARVTTTLEVMVSPEDDAEVRRVSITNHGTRTREIELTSYAEIALARQADDVAHPAFAKLFVETEFVPDLGAILATRRRRSPAIRSCGRRISPWSKAKARATCNSRPIARVFSGVDRPFARPPPSPTAGRFPTRPVPCSIPSSACAGMCGFRAERRRASRSGRWPPPRAKRCSIWPTSITTPMAFERAKTLAWTQAQMQLHHLGIDSDEAHLFQRLANHILYSDPTLRPPRDVLKRGAGKASTLWAQGISGDLPIVLVRIEDDDHLELVRQLLRAHEYWRLKQLAVDLVILNERAASYVQDLQTSLEALVRMNQSMPAISRAAIRAGQCSSCAPISFRRSPRSASACARAVLHGNRGSLADQIKRARDLKPAARRLRVRALPSAAGPETPLPRPEMEFFNGLGGFTNDGREYLTILEGNDRTPAPWLNIVANPSFGFQVSTDGSGFTWSVNSQQNQLTPWSNDPVGDAPGEAIYVRDEDSGEVWGPTALPIREKTASYAVRHGQGYSRFEPCLARHFARASAICAGRRFDQDFAAEDRQSFGARAASFDHGLCGMGSGPEPLGDRALHRDRDRSRHRRDLRAESVERSIWRARRVRGSEWPANGVDRATARNFWAATARWIGRLR